MKNLLLFIQKYETNPSKENAELLKRFLHEEDFEGSSTLLDALLEARRLMNEWEPLDDEWHELLKRMV